MGAIVIVIVEAATLSVIDNQGYDSSIVKLACPHSVAVENMYVVAVCPTEAVWFGTTTFAHPYPVGQPLMIVI